jgi:aquaporin Z
MMFLFVIMGATHGKAPVGFAPIAIGLALTLIHLVGIPVINLSQPGPQHRGRRSSAGGRWPSSGCSGWRPSSAA